MQCLCLSSQLNYSKIYMLLSENFGGHLIRKIKEWIGQLGRKCVYQNKQGGIGFKDQIIFNQVLLAKQGWRLVRYPNSLVAHVLKAKYFPKVHFLKASLGQCPSYTWRSLLYGRELLNSGLRWRIGRGDPWLPSGGSFKPITPFCFMRETLLVEDLIQHEVWNKELVTTLFCQLDAEYVLCCYGGSEQLIWHYTPARVFSVASGV